MAILKKGLRMTTEEFLAVHNNAPYDLEEVAGLVSEITDNDDISILAKLFLDIQDDLRMRLLGIGFEFG